MSQKDFGSMSEKSEEYKFKLIESVLKMVTYIANDYKGMGVDINDLIQEGNLGVIEAVEKFDPEKGKFSSFAGWYIKMRIKKYLNKHQHNIKQPAVHKNRTIKIHKFIEKYKNKHSSIPTEKQIMNELNISKLQLKNANLYKINSMISTDICVNTLNHLNTSTLESVLLTEENNDLNEEIIKKDDYKRLSYLLNTLDDVDKFIIKERFYNRCSLQNVGDKLGVSLTTIKNHQDRILKTLKSAI